MKIIERLNQLKPALYKRYFEWNQQKTWLGNAVEEGDKRSFCAIIAQDNLQNLVAVMREIDLDEDPRWCAETQRRIERTATEMAACADHLLRYARHILFIDPHFDPREKRFKRPLQAFLQAVAKRHASIPINRIEIHTGHESAGSKAFFDTACRQHLPSIIPRGMKICLIRWDQDYLHNRFILTECGGLKFGVGLDDHNDSANANDIVDLLEPRPYARTWQDYQRDTSPFPLIEDDLIIEGTA